VKQDTFDSTWQIKAGFVQRPLQEKNKSKSKQETVPPAIPKNKRKRSNDGVIPASEGANRRLQQKQSQHLGPSHQRVEPDEDGNAAATVQPPETNHINESLEVPEDIRGKSDGQKVAEPKVTRSRRQGLLARRLIEAMVTEIVRSSMHDIMGEIYCLSALYPYDDHEPGSEEQSILAYKA
jgi:hypothetical protein